MIDKLNPIGDKIIAIMKKKVVILLSVIIAITGLGILALEIYNDDRLVAKDSLPNKIVDFVNTNFPGTTIRSADIDFLDYTVWLNDETIIEFDWTRKWEKIERFSLSIPSQLIPNEITSHVKNNYPESIINKISIDDNRYEVNISGQHFELSFDKNGNYIGIDK